MKGGFCDSNVETIKLKEKINNILYKNRGNIDIPSKIDPKDFSAALLKKNISAIINDIYPKDKKILSESDLEQISARENLLIGDTLELSKHFYEYICSYDISGCIRKNFPDLKSYNIVDDDGYILKESPINSLDISPNHVNLTIQNGFVEPYKNSRVTPDPPYYFMINPPQNGGKYDKQHLVDLYLPLFVRGGFDYLIRNYIKATLEKSFYLLPDIYQPPYMDFYNLLFQLGDDGAMIINKSYSNIIHLLVVSGQIGKFIDILYDFRSDGLIIEKTNYYSIVSKLKEIGKNPTHDMTQYTNAIKKACNNKTKGPLLAKKFEEIYNLLKDLVNDKLLYLANVSSFLDFFNKFNTTRNNKNKLTTLRTTFQNVIKYADLSKTSVKESILLDYVFVMLSINSTKRFRHMYAGFIMLYNCFITRRIAI